MSFYLNDFKSHLSALAEKAKTEGLVDYTEPVRPWQNTVSLEEAYRGMHGGAEKLNEVGVSPIVEQASYGGLATQSWKPSPPTTPIDPPHQPPGAAIGWKGPDLGKRMRPTWFWRPPGRLPWPGVAPAALHRPRDPGKYPGPGDISPQQWHGMPPSTGIRQGPGAWEGDGDQAYRRPRR